MILHFQPCTPRHLNTSDLSFSFSFKPPSSPCLVLKSPKPVTLRIRCSISRVHSYGTVDYEKRPFLKWKSVYKKLSFTSTGYPDLSSSSSSTLNQWEHATGYSLFKWELCRIVKELRKYGRFKRALEVYEWMNNQPERFRLSTSDAAIQLDLIAKVHGISSAEEFFNRLPDDIKDKRIYGSLHNAYVQYKMVEQAESLMEQMRDKGYCNHALPYNLMTSLYMKFKDYDKVESLVSEMMEKNIRLDVFTYNIWLQCRGAQGSLERMEQVYEQMKVDNAVYPNWTSFGTMATVYIDTGEIEKGVICLKKIEDRITGRDRIPYHHLFTLYGKAGKKDDIYRLWNTYKSLFPSIPNGGYVALMASLIKAGDIAGAEKMYKEEWLVGKTYYDPRIPNLLINAYVREGKTEKAERLLRNMVGDGGQPIPRTFEILAEGCIAKREIGKALAYVREASSITGSAPWRLKPVNMRSFSKLCEEEGDLKSKEAMEELVRQSGWLEDEVYASHMGFSDGDEVQQKMEQNGSSSDGESERVDGFEF